MEHALRAVVPTPTMGCAIYAVLSGFGGLLKSSPRGSREKRRAQVRELRGASDFCQRTLRETAFTIHGTSRANRKTQRLHELPRCGPPLNELASREKW